MELEKAYEVFKIKKGTVDLDELKKIYRNLTKKYHPDLYNNNPLLELAQEKLKEINEAYEIIKEELEKVEVFTIQDYIVTKDELGKSYYINRNTSLPLNGEVEIKTIIDGYIRGKVKNGLLEGKVCTYYSDGTLIGEREFFNGVVEGVEITYSYDNFSKPYISKTREYKSGIASGKEIAYRLNTLNERVIALEKEYLYGKVINIKEFDENGKLKLENIINKKEEILDYNLDNLYYDEGYSTGEIEFKYTNFIEKCEVDKGRLNGLSDVIYLENNTINKKFYRNGIENVRFFSRLKAMYSTSKLKELYYEYNNETQVISMNSLQYHFYIRYIELIVKSTNSELGYLLVTDYIEILHNLVEKNKKLLEKWLQDYILRPIDYEKAINLENDIGLKRALNPTSLEDYAIKLRRCQMLLEFDDLKKEIENLKSVYLTDTIKKEWIGKVKDEIYTIYFRNFGFNESTLTMKKLPKFMEYTYVIDVFKQANDNGYISNDTILYANLFLVNLPKTLLLLNFYIALKYNMDYHKVYKEIKEVISQSNLIYDDFRAFRLVLEEIYGIKTTIRISDFLLILKIFFEENINIDINKIKINKIKSLESLLFEVKAKNNIFNILYEKVDKNRYEKNTKEFEEIIETLKQKIEVEKRKKIEEHIQKLEERLFIVSLNKLKENSIEYDIREISKLSSIIEELKKIMDNREYKCKVEEISDLKAIIDCLKVKEQYYTNKYNEVKKSKNELQKIYLKSPDMFNRWLFSSLIGIVLIFTMFGILWGISSIVWLPIIVYKTLKANREQKVREARNKVDQLEIKEKQLKKILNILGNFMNNI